MITNIITQKIVQKLVQTKKSLKRFSKNKKKETKFPKKIAQKFFKQKVMFSKFPKKKINCTKKIFFQNFPKKSLKNSKFFFKIFPKKLCTKKSFKNLEYTLFAAQQRRNGLFIGGFTDRPGNNRDYYHTCYALSGMSVMQHIYGSDGSIKHKIVGHKENEIAMTNPLHNVRTDL